MDAADRSFYSRLGVIFGPLFVIGGFLAAFTYVGAILIWAGLALLTAGIALKTPMPWQLAVAVATALFLALCAYTAFVYP